MTTEQYKKAMAEMGISRGGLEADAEIDDTPSGSQLTPLKERVLLNPRASTVPARVPMEEVPERFHSSHPQNKTARKWWDSLSPEERQKQRRQRAINARGQGKKAASVLPPAARE